MTTTTELLWFAVIASGVYHGINPGMGWPLAVSAGLMDRRPRALFAALVPLAIGHFLAMAIVLLPFTLLLTLAQWEGRIRMAVGAAVALFGFWKLFNRRHARLLARIRPTQLAFWSFAVAIAHGAGFMLVPIYLGLSGTGYSGMAHAGMPAANAEMLPAHAAHMAAASPLAANLGMALLVSIVHAAAMITAGGLAAWVCYRFLGVKFISQAWLNLDLAWAFSLILVGALGFVSGLNA